MELAAVEEAAAKPKRQRDVRRAAVVCELGDHGRVERSAVLIHQRDDEFAEFVAESAARDSESSMMCRHARMEGKRRHDTGQEMPPDALRDDGEERAGIDDALGERGHFPSGGAGIDATEEADERPQTQSLDAIHAPVGAEEDVLVRLLGLPEVQADAGHGYTSRGVV